MLVQVTEVTKREIEVEASPTYLLRSIRDMWLSSIGCRGESPNAKRTHWEFEEGGGTHSWTCTSRPITKHELITWDAFSDVFKITETL